MHEEWVPRRVSGSLSVHVPEEAKQAFEAFVESAGLPLSMNPSDYGGWDATLRCTPSLGEAVLSHFRPSRHSFVLRCKLDVEWGNAFEIEDPAPKDGAVAMYTPRLRAAAPGRDWCLVPESSKGDTAIRELGIYVTWEKKGVDGWSENFGGRDKAAVLKHLESRFDPEDVRPTEGGAEIKIRYHGFYLFRELCHALSEIDGFPQQ